jgi:hypothetical protein
MITITTLNNMIDKRMMSHTILMTPSHLTRTSLKFNLVIHHHIGNRLISKLKTRVKARELKWSSKMIYFLDLTHLRNIREIPNQISVNLSKIKVFKSILRNHQR